MESAECSKPSKGIVGPAPAAEEEQCRERGYGESVDVLGEEEYSPVRAAVLHEGTANYFRFGMVDVEGRASKLG